MIESIVGRCREFESGARNVDHILTGSLLPEMSREFLAKLAEGQTVSKRTSAWGTMGRLRTRWSEAAARTGLRRWGLNEDTPGRYMWVARGRVPPCA